MLRRTRQEGSVRESWGMTIEARRAAIVHLLKPSAVAEQERALNWQRISGFQELVSRSFNAGFTGTVIAGFYGGDKTRVTEHGYYDLQRASYQGTLSRLAVAGTYRGEVVAYDDFTDNPTIASNVPPVSHFHRMEVGQALEDIVSQLRAEQSSGWNVLREVNA